MNPRQGIETWGNGGRQAFISSLRGRKTVNPRQGIETELAPGERVRGFLGRKTVNPRQGIETPPPSPHTNNTPSPRRKTVNPRQGIETRYKLMRNMRVRMRSEDSESSSGD